MTCLRRVVNAIFYLLQAGCQWRMLPKDFPRRSTVYGYFREPGPSPGGQRRATSHDQSGCTLFAPFRGSVAKYLGGACDNDRKCQVHRNSSR